MALEQVKRTVLDYFDALETCALEAAPQVLADRFSETLIWRGVHPFNEIGSVVGVAEQVWQPLKRAFTGFQRRQDIFFAGANQVGPGNWAVSMGHFAGLFDEPFLGIPPTGRLATLRYAEFNRVDDGKIVESGFFIDLIGLMQLAGYSPLPPSTGAYFTYPGPRTHDGLLLTPQPPEDAEVTDALLERMINDLNDLNETGEDRCPPEFLARCWHDDMIWYGPAGIGATYTISRYQQQHQYPFREGLGNKRFNGHVCRAAEGHYAAFFGWPNLTNRAIGGFLGLPASDRDADMRVVDVYRRDGDKLAENWVFIDLPYWLKQQGLDVFERLEALKA